MQYQAQKGKVVYGESVGILLLDDYAVHPPGDVANATSFDFPVKYKVVEGLTVGKMLSKDMSMLNSICDAAKSLEYEGAKAITGDCGYMLYYQKYVQKQLNVPIFLSSLLQLSILSSIISDDDKIGVVCANDNALDTSLLGNVNIANLSQIKIKGLQDKEHFVSSYIYEKGYVDTNIIKNEVIQTAKDLVSSDDSIKILLLECSIIPSYSYDVQVATKLPVYDYITMINYIYSGLIQKKYIGQM